MNRNSFKDPAGDELSCGFFFGEEPQPDALALKCSKLATLGEIYFSYWHAYERHKLPFPRRKGLFDDSLWIFSCEKHLEAYLRTAPQQFSVLEIPEIIVNAQLDLEETLYQTVLLRTKGIVVPKDYFTARKFYGGRENLHEVWEREKKHFQF